MIRLTSSPPYQRMSKTESGNLLLTTEFDPEKLLPVVLNLRKTISNPIEVLRVTFVVLHAAVCLLNLDYVRLPITTTYLMAYLKQC